MSADRVPFLVGSFLVVLGAGLVGGSHGCILAVGIVFVLMSIVEPRG
jgi:hypothetical protein